MNRIFCKDCLFWHFVEGTGDLRIGDCRKYAPLPFRDTDYPKVEDTNTIVTIWPITFPNDWCGEAKLENGKLAPQDTLSIPLVKEDFCMRVWNILDWLKVKTIGDLLNLTEKGLLHTRGIGVTSILQIKKFLRERGLELLKEHELVEHRIWAVSKGD